MCEHEKCAARATCGDVYVHIKFEENPSIDKQTLNHKRALAVSEHDTYLAYVTRGDL
jgi:hypothetical protein